MLITLKHIMIDRVIVQFLWTLLTVDSFDKFDNNSAKSLEGCVF